MKNSVFMDGYNDIVDSSLARSPRRVKKSAAPDLPLFVLSTTEDSARVSRLVKQGRLRPLGSRLYTSDLHTPLEELGRRMRWQILGLLFPGAVITHRSALETHPASDGSLIVSGAYPRILKLPGVTIRQVAGPGPLDGDRSFGYGLHLASEARAFLENLVPSRGRGGFLPRTLGWDAVEERLARIVAQRGPEAANEIRDLARRVAPALDAAAPFSELDGLIGALLATRGADARALSTRAGLAVARGEPYDTTRVARFDALASALRDDGGLASRPLRFRDAVAFGNAGFFDAYFSNFIEGTRFTVEEARSILFDGAMPPHRPADAHDILGTFRLVSDPTEMARRAGTFEDFLQVLRSRHAAIMEGRPEVRGGEFKEQANQAGTTAFVAPPLVLGTLRQGWELLTGLHEPGARALFVMFLVAEVHPFADGNGRVARVMMNGELLAGGQERIIIPSVYRNEYLAGLRRLSHHDDPTAFVRVMDVAHQLVSMLPFRSFDATCRVLHAARAFEDPSDEVRLIIPVEGVNRPAN